MKKSNNNSKKKPKNIQKKKPDNVNHFQDVENSSLSPILKKPKELLEEKVILFLEKMKDKKSDHLFSSNFKKDLKNWFPCLTPSSNINIDFNIYISKKENYEKKKKKSEKNTFEKKIKKEIVVNYINDIINKSKRKINPNKKISNFEIFLPKPTRIISKKKILQKSKIQTYQDFLNFRINFEDTISDEIIKKDKYFFQIDKLKKFWLQKDNKTPFVFKRQNISDNNCISEIIDFSQKIA